MEKVLKKLFVLGLSIVTSACAPKVNFDLPATTENFDQGVNYNNKVDIVWVIDNSSSMLKHQQRLSDQIPQLIGTLNSLKMNYHMAVVTSSIGGTANDGGRFIGTPKFVTSETPDLVNTFKSHLIVGEAGNNNERGLESLRNAFAPSYLSNEGKGFLRDDALLVVIALSDEEDKSAISNPVASLTAFFDSLKAPWIDGSRSWVFNFIGVLSMSANCKTFNDYVEVGSRFIDLADETGGVKETICTANLSTAVSNIRARIYEILTDFKLSKLPVVETITVSIAGKSIPRSNVNGWDYIESLNLVRFYGSAVPAADVSIKVDFKPREAN